MARTRIRGFEWAGLRLALEVPSGWSWDWPTGLAESVCHPEDPDVHVSVHPLRETRGLESAIPYCHEGSLFEMGRGNGDSYVSVTGDRRAARFSQDLRFCDVWLPPSAIRGRIFPLARPLDDLVVIHRALLRGALAVRATAAVRSGRALVVLGESNLAEPDSGPDAETAMWAGWLLLDPQPEGTRVYPLPSTRQTGSIAAGGAVLDGLHVMDSVADGEFLTGTLDPEIAATEILRFAFAPLAGANTTDRVVTAATRLAAGRPVLRLGGAGGQRFGWRRSRHPLSLVPPAGA